MGADFEAAIESIWKIIKFLGHDEICIITSSMGSYGLFRNHGVMAPAQFDARFGARLVPDRFGPREMRKKTYANLGRAVRVDPDNAAFQKQQNLLLSLIDHGVF